MRTLDPNERKKLWAQMDDAARRLGVMSLPKLHIGMLVEKDGIVLTNQREEGHSWTRNMWNAIFGTHTHCGGSSETFGAGYISSKNTGGTVKGGTGYSVSLLYFTTMTTPNSDFGFCYSTASSSRGIVVGTDDTAFDIDDYALGAIIAHGNGAGQLSYVGMDKPSLDYTSKVWTASLVRLFNNNSGDTITVKEVGIISRSALFNSYNDCFLLARDVLGSPVAVANGAQLTVTYEISMDFSSIDT